MDKTNSRISLTIGHTVLGTQIPNTSTLVVERGREDGQFLILGENTCVYREEDKKKAPKPRLNVAEATRTLSSYRYSCTRTD